MFAYMYMRLCEYVCVCEANKMVSNKKPERGERDSHMHAYMHTHVISIHTAHTNIQYKCTYTYTHTHIHIHIRLEVTRSLSYR